MKIASQKTPQRKDAPVSASRRRRLEKILKQFLAGKVSLMSLSALDDAFLQNPHHRVHE
jgi:hypothetical protein